MRRAQIRNRLPLLNPSIDFELTDDDVFSKMHYRCNNVEFFEYIEPLVGILRDPLTMCDDMDNLLTMHENGGVFNAGESYVQSKRYLLLEPASAVSDALPTRLRCPSNACVGARRLLFDFGASTYHGWGDADFAIGSKWLVERYRAFNESFDHIYAFDAASHVPSEIVKGLSAEFLTRYSYYNVGITGVF